MAISMRTGSVFQAHKPYYNLSPTSTLSFPPWLWNRQYINIVQAGALNEATITIIGWTYCFNSNNKFVVSWCFILPSPAHCAMNAMTLLVKGHYPVSVLKPGILIILYNWSLENLTPWSSIVSWRTTILWIWPTTSMTDSFGIALATTWWLFKDVALTIHC